MDDIYNQYYYGYVAASSGEECMDVCFKDKGSYAATWKIYSPPNLWLRHDKSDACKCEQSELGVECSFFFMEDNTYEYWHLNYVDLDKDGVNDARIPEPEPVVVLEWWEYLYDNVGNGRCLDYG
jgi:hypothetical protein